MNREIKNTKGQKKHTSLKIGVVVAVIVIIILLLLTGHSLTMVD